MFSGFTFWSSNEYICISVDIISERKKYSVAIDVDPGFLVKQKYLRTENRSNHPPWEWKPSKLVKLTVTLFKTHRCYKTFNNLLFTYFISKNFDNLCITPLPTPRTPLFTIVIFKTGFMKVNVVNKIKALHLNIS